MLYRIILSYAEDLEYMYMYLGTYVICTLLRYKLAWIANSKKKHHVFFLGLQRNTLHVESIYFITGALGAQRAMDQTIDVRGRQIWGLHSGSGEMNTERKFMYRLFTSS